MNIHNVPPMGWNSWNTFGKDISEDLIKEIADIMVEKGYLEAGYDYLVIDDGWQAEERENGHIVADKERFPNGIKAVSDYVHSRGLKFGIYSASGIKTCLGRPGSFGYEYTDAEDFASWGVDYLKYDLCHFAGCENITSAYFNMSMALRSTKRDIVFSVATCGEGEPSKWARAIGAHMYRSTGDILDCFGSIKKIATDQLDNLSESASGCYNDPDMLVVGMNGIGYAGRGGCSYDEYLVHFGLWCMYSVPLMIGADIRKIEKPIEKMLLNRELISINQDEESRFPYFERKDRYSSKDRLILFKVLKDGKFVLGFFNMADSDLTMDAYLADYGIPAYSKKGLHLKDVMTGEDIGIKKDFVSIPLKQHSCRIFKGEIE